MAQGPERGGTLRSGVGVGRPSRRDTSPAGSTPHGSLADSRLKWNLRAGFGPPAFSWGRYFTARSAQPWSVWRFRPHTPWDSWARGPESASWTACFFSDHVSLRLSPPIAVRDFVDQDDVVEPGLEDPPGSGSHGTALWSLMSGDWPGNVGTAPGSGILLARVHDGSDPVSADEDRSVGAWDRLRREVPVVCFFVMSSGSSGEGVSQDGLNGDVGSRDPGSG